MAMGRCAIHGDGRVGVALLAHAVHSDSRRGRRVKPQAILARIVAALLVAAAIVLAGRLFPTADPKPAEACEGSPC